MDEKRFHRSHTRKYVGVIFTVGNFNYYAPFSSPKVKDLKTDGSIKKMILWCPQGTIVNSPTSCGKMSLY